MFYRKHHVPSSSISNGLTPAPTAQCLCFGNAEAAVQGFINSFAIQQYEKAF